MANNLIIKDGNNTARTIHTIEDSTSAHFNMSIPIDVSGHAVAMVTNGQTVASTMNAMVVAQRDGLPAGANLIGSVSISPNGLNIPVSVANTPAVTQSGTWNVGVNAGTNLMGAVSVRQIVSVQPDGTANWPVSVAGTIAATQSGTWGINVNGAIVSTNNLATINAVNGSLYTIAHNYAWDGTVWRIMSSDTSGRLNVNANTSLGGSTALIGSVSISPNGLNIPVSVASTGAPSADALNFGAAQSLRTMNANFVYNSGSGNWDRWDGKVSVGNTANIGVSVAAGKVSVAGIVTVAPAANFLAALPAGGFAVGGEVSSANGTFTSGHLAPLQLDANGRLKISGTITGGSMTQTVGAAVTSEGYPMLGSDGTLARRLLTTTGGALVVHVSNSQPAASGIAMTQTVAAVVTTEGYPMLGTDGTNARGLLVDTSGRLIISAISDNKVSVVNPLQAGTALIGAVSVRQIVSVQPDGTANWPVSVAGTAAVTQSGTWNVGVNAGTNLMGAVSVRQIVSVQPDGTANWPVSVAGTAAVTQSGTWTVQPGNTPNTAPWLFTEVPTSVDGLTPITTLISAYTSGYLVKGAAGKVYSVQGFNNAATPLYLRLFNKATAPAASDAPYIVFMIPGNTAGAGFVYSVPTGITFGTGIGWRISGGINNTDATNPTDNQGIVNIFYK